jgi:hypothetical protein
MWIHKHHEEIEKLICSKCPADINKDYSPCKNCKRGDDFELGYEAGLHADVHTDNSAVIAELETQIEIKDIQIKDLQEQKYYWKESSFDWRHKFFKKGRIKQLIEKEKRIKDLEKEKSEIINLINDCLWSCVNKNFDKVEEGLKSLLNEYDE